MLTLPTARRRTNRLTHAQQQVIALIRAQPMISYDEIAARLLIDRNTAIRAVHRLIAENRMVKLTGNGRQPNRYLLTEQVFRSPLGYRPTPILLSELARQRLMEQWQRRSGALQ